MPTISEKEFDQLVHHTIRIDMTDGTLLIYNVTPEEKQFLINFLRNFSSGEVGQEKRTAMGLLMFETYPKRLVFINIAYMMRLIFCFDNPLGNSNKYRDNFNILEKDEQTEDSFVIETEEILLPQAIIKLPGIVSYTDSDVLTFNSIKAGDLLGLDMEVQEEEMVVREFIELIDDDGENNFFPVSQIMCMEMDTNIVFEDEEDEQ